MTERPKKRAAGAKRSRRTQPRTLIGWREWAVLPDLSPVPIKAKVDTGARTSALHAFDLRIVERNGEQWAHFEVHPVQRSDADSSVVSAPVRAFKSVRSSTGHAQRRPVIRTPVQIGPHRFEIDVTLTSRDEMGFRMLLGRAAVRRRFWVDPGRSYLVPPPTSPTSTKRKTP